MHVFYRVLNIENWREKIEKKDNIPSPRLEPGTFETPVQHSTSGLYHHSDMTAMDCILYGVSSSSTVTTPRPNGNEPQMQIVHANCGVLLGPQVQETG